MIPSESMTVELKSDRKRLPRIARWAFREALANALTHRDYSRLGAVHVRLMNDTLVISNPGGLVDGVTISNLLTTEPHPRNPALAVAFKRTGLVERTGRGVKLIYRGLLRYGRARPDYTRSDGYNVVLEANLGAADLDFLRLILEEEDRLGEPLPIDSLIVLSALQHQRRLNREELAVLIQRQPAAVGRTIEALRERGLVQSHGRTKGTTYTLAPAVYVRFGQQAEYTRQVGFSRLQQEQMVCSYVLDRGSVTRSEVVELCGISDKQATRLLQEMTDNEFLESQGERRWRTYHRGPRLLEAGK